MSYPFPISPDEFKGMRVLVTGGTAWELSSSRDLSRPGLPSQRLLAGRFRTDQRPALFIQTDIGLGDGAAAVVERVNREWVGVHILINCVGGSEAPNGGFSALSDQDWTRALDVNLLAAVRMDRVSYPE